MTARIIGAGPRLLSGRRDPEGHRTYRVQWQVETTTIQDGPFAVMRAPGLPTPGSFWNIGADVDPWAFCTWEMDVNPHPDIKPGKPVNVWTVDQVFTTRPPDRQRSAGDFGGGGGGGSPSSPSGVENPLMEPFKVSGSFLKYQKELAGVFNSSHEQMRGPQVEFEECMHQIRIEQNVLGRYYGYQLPAFLINRVNRKTLWGMPPRTIRLSNVSWERLYYGLWIVYYKRVLEFDINPDTFDRRLDDEGTKVLSGEWNETTGLWDDKAIEGYEGAINPDPENPDHFIRFRDRQGEFSRVILNGAGRPYVPAVPGATIAITPATDYTPLSGVPRISTFGRYHGLVPVSSDNLQHWYKCSAAGLSRKIVVQCNDAEEAERVLVETYSATTGYNPATTLRCFSNGRYVIAIGTASTDDMLISVEIRYGGAVTYNIKVEGTDLTNQPGVITVRKHPGADFLPLLIPTAF